MDSPHTPVKHLLFSRSYILHILLRNTHPRMGKGVADRRRLTFALHDSVFPCLNRYHTSHAVHPYWLCLSFYSLGMLPSLPPLFPNVHIAECISPCAGASFAPWHATRNSSLRLSNICRYHLSLDSFFFTMQSCTSSFHHQVSVLTLLYLGESTRISVATLLTTSAVSSHFGCYPSLSLRTSISTSSPH